MGDAFITRRGGGIKEGYALIAVTYPAGSVCTCTNGTKTLRAKGTSGEYLFSIPEAGTWVVSCTDGSQTASQSVVIDSQYQTEDVTLVYKLYLYDAGNEFVDVTGGWQVNSRKYDDVYVARSPDITKGNNSITLSQPSGNIYSGSLQTANIVNVLGYSALHALFDINCIGDAEQKAFCTLYGDVNQGTNQISASCVTNSTRYYGGQSYTDVELTVEVSELSSLYIGFGVSNVNSSVKSTVNVKKIWLS